MDKDFLIRHQKYYPYRKRDKGLHCEKRNDSYRDSGSRMKRHHVKWKNILISYAILTFNKKTTQNKGLLQDKKKTSDKTVDNGLMT